MLQRCVHCIRPKRRRARWRTCNREATHCVRIETQIEIAGNPTKMISTQQYMCPKHAAAFDRRAGAKVMQPIERSE